VPLIGAGKIGIEFYHYLGDIIDKSYSLPKILNSMLSGAHINLIIEKK
jgi:hypothetical protein